MRPAGVAPPAIATYVNKMESIPGKEEMSKMNRLLAVCALLVLSLPGTSGADQAGGSKAETEIRQLENRRIQAMLKVDTEELNRILADDLTYTHSSGQVDTKSQLIESLKSG